MITKVKDYGDYCIVWYEDGSRKTYAYIPEAVEEFKDFCSEKGFIRRVGQAIEYSVDPNFKSL